jgi:hypothetical protein
MENMTISQAYWWQKTYDAAVLELNSSRLPERVVEALAAIEERMRSCIVYGSVEHVEIANARRALAILSSKNGHSS